MIERFDGRGKKKSAIQYSFRFTLKLGELEMFDLFFTWIIPINL